MRYCLSYRSSFESKSLENNHDMSEEVFRFLVELYNERKKHECLIGEILF